MKYLLPFSLSSFFQGLRSFLLQALKIAIHERTLISASKHRLVSSICFWLCLKVNCILNYCFTQRGVCKYIFSDILALHINCTDSPKSGTNLAILHQSHQDRLKTLRLEFQSKRIRLHLKNEELKFSSNIWVLKEFR